MMLAMVTERERNEQTNGMRNAIKRNNKNNESKIKTFHFLFTFYTTVEEAGPTG